MGWLDTVLKAAAAAVDAGGAVAKGVLVGLSLTLTDNKPPATLGPDEARAWKEGADDAATTLGSRVSAILGQAHVRGSSRRETLIAAATTVRTAEPPSLVGAARDGWLACQAQALKQFEDAIAEDDAQGRVAAARLRALEYEAKKKKGG